MRAIELISELHKLFDDGKITNDTEIVINLDVSSTSMWKSEIGRVVSIENSNPEFLVKNEILKAQFLVLSPVAKNAIIKL